MKMAEVSRKLHDACAVYGPSALVAYIVFAPSRVVVATYRVAQTRKLNPILH